MNYVLMLFFWWLTTVPHMVAHNSTQESDALFWPLWAPGMYIVQDINAAKH